MLSSYDFSNLLLKLAESKYEKQKGLMNIDKLDNIDGMFFLYKEPKIIKMWMHNTRIPLDIIFIDEFNKVISVNYGKPYSKKVISAKKKPIAVIEIPYKCSKKLNLKKGVEVSWDNVSKNKKTKKRYYHCLAK